MASKDSSTDSKKQKKEYSTEFSRVLISSSTTLQGTLISGSIKSTLGVTTCRDTAECRQDPGTMPKLQLEPPRTSSSFQLHSRYAHVPNLPFVFSVNSHFLYFSSLSISF
ncbi:hypothetical protein PV325_011937 [Microctonus aethiopoides]|nr:hypothetical protein PV325_011937 [Microctonus aethiopoides]KAK0094451.1 hypothetical protein PV326_010859 [Microctonus aethiopoides]